MNRRHCLGLLATLPLALPGVAAAASDFDRVRAEVWAKQRRFVETPQGAIACVDSGQGTPALFLHGFPLNGFQWREVVEYLSIGHRCIVPDLLGMGSTRPAPGQDLAPLSQVAMLAALLDRLGADRVHLVASDSGGAVAQLFATRHPERVRTLLLTNCDTEFESPPAAMAPVIALARRGEYAAQWLAPWLADKALARSDKGIGAMCYADPRHPVDAAIDTYFTPLIESPAARARTDAYAVALAENPLAGIGPKLAASPVPARVLWGVDDTIFSLAAGERLARSFGRSQGLRRVANARLFWPEEQPRLVADEAEALWARFPEG